MERITEKQEIIDFFESLKFLPYYKNSINNRKSELNLLTNKVARFWHKVLMLVDNITFGFFDLKKAFLYSHEDFFESFLKSKGFQSAIIDDKAFDSEKKYYVKEPLGRNSSPDFWIYYYGYKFSLELKSNSQDKIKWNSLPEDHIYLFSCKKTDSSMLFLGKDIIDDSIKKLYKSLKEDVQKVVSKYKKDFEISENNRHGWSCTNGALWVCQLGKKPKTNYINHPRSQELQDNVIKHIKKYIDYEDRDTTHSL